VPDWRFKAALQGALSKVPGGRTANYHLQRVTKGLPIPDSLLISAVDIAHRHVGSAQEHLNVDLREATFFEFGAGWDLHVPITLYALGAGRQTVVDLHRLVQTDLVRDVSRRLAAVPGIVQYPVHAEEMSLEDLLAQMGITYLAPTDARRTDLPDASIDVVSSTNTLEHIPAADITHILREMHRILRPGGILSARIDYQDHYSYFDHSISIYNFLRYSDREWRWFNNDLHYQNRLRHHQHLKLIEDAGFCVLAVEADEPDVDDLRVLQRIQLAEPFASQHRQHVGIRGAMITATRA
jgi:SAM-dependent methyltransferase